jgi:hypothetical protein
MREDPVFLWRPNTCRAERLHLGGGFLQQAKLVTGVFAGRCCAAAWRTRAEGLRMQSFEPSSNGGGISATVRQSRGHLTNALQQSMRSTTLTNRQGSRSSLGRYMIRPVPVRRLPMRPSMNGSDCSPIGRLPGQAHSSPADHADFGRTELGHLPGRCKRRCGNGSACGSWPGSILSVHVDRKRDGAALPLPGRRSHSAGDQKI